MLQTYSYAANALGNFVEGVRSEPWGKNTLIAATGDHNARFSYQPNGWYHHANGVPILFWLPDGFKPAAVPPSKQWVSHRDIFPTLRGIALGEKPALYQGRDIFEPGIPDAADTFTGIESTATRSETPERRAWMAAESFSASAGRGIG